MFKYFSLCLFVSCLERLSFGDVIELRMKSAVARDAVETEKEVTQKPNHSKSGLCPWILCNACDVTSKSLKY